MQGYIKRSIEDSIRESLLEFPAVAILGARQVGKSTTARTLVGAFEKSAYLDLELPSDLVKLEAPELYFQTHGGDPRELICLDEIQRAPDLFPVLRSVIDQRDRSGQFLILGSASRDLLRQSSESLAGRIAFFELSPFQLGEVACLPGWSSEDRLRLWLRGGFPRSYLAASNSASVRWRENFVRSYLERDIPQLGFTIPAETLRRLWTMLAHNQGQLLNSSAVGRALGLSHTTVRSYVDLLTQTFMVRVLPPLEANVKKRLVKSPKTYIRDTGILHSLLQIDSLDDLLGHPVSGHSWETLVVENAIAAHPGHQAHFYRTSAGAELDLVLTRGRRRIAVECKLSRAPNATRGFWNALEDLGIDQAWIIAPVDESYHIDGRVQVAPPRTFLQQSPRT